MLTGNDVKILDINAEFFGTPPSTLMENAGLKIARFITKKYPNKSILIFCGLGNNGGDGFVAARHLSEKQQVSLILTGKEEDIKTNIAKINFQKLKSFKIKIIDSISLDSVDTFLDQADIIIDAMLGVGLTGKLREPFQTLVEKINTKTNKPVISVDVPTGMGLDVSIKADHTITFHDKKAGMNSNQCGIIHVEDIGIPQQAEIYIGPGDLQVLYPKPKKESHKGQNGRVLVIGGGPYYGAPTLSALASLRTGADLAYIACPSYTANIISHFSPNLIVKPLLSNDYLQLQDVKRISKFIETVDSIIIGPGLGDKNETKDAIVEVVQLIMDACIPLVIDADAISAIGKKHDLIEHSATVITPHKNELKEFLFEPIKKDLDERKKQVEKWAKNLGIAIFLKGPIDILSDGNITRLNIVHNEAMTVGGTGDVLAGVIGSLLSKKVSPINACRIAAYLNGQSGNMAFKKYSYGLVATDVINELPHVLKENIR